MTTGSTTTLAALRRGDRAVVERVADDGERFGDTRESTIARRLLELGFVPGAALEIVASMWPGDDPLAVRIGGSTFALRHHEARAVHVRREVR
ncbi:MAG: FeoA family protein [Steroidobacteraceae bacterium]